MLQIIQMALILVLKISSVFFLRYEKVTFKRIYYLIIIKKQTKSIFFLYIYK